MKPSKIIEVVATGVTIVVLKDIAMTVYRDHKPMILGTLYRLKDHVHVSLESKPKPKSKRRKLYDGT